MEDEKKRSTIDGKTVEEIFGSGETPGEFFARRLEETGGRMTLVQNGKKFVFTGVKIIGHVHDAQLLEGEWVDGVVVEHLPMKFAAHQHDMDGTLLIGHPDHPGACELCAEGVIK